MRINRLCFVLIFSIILLFWHGLAWSEDDHGFTQKDREVLVALKVKVEEMDKRFEQRFQEIDKRFEFIQNLLIAMLGVFGGLCGAFVALLLWDQKTFKDKAKEEAIREIEEKSRVMKALKKYSEVEPKMADVLRSLGLL